MKNFEKFSYSVRAIAVGAFLLANTYVVLEQAGVVDKAIEIKDNIIRKHNNKKLNKVLERSRKMYEGNPVVEEAAMNTYYSECFRNKGN